jgi:deazaflavin-dependent oxidoreductase (nitroreductase family)
VDVSAGIDAASGDRPLQLGIVNSTRSPPAPSAKWPDGQPLSYSAWQMHLWTRRKQRLHNDHPGRVQRLAAQNVLKRIVRGLLRVPLLSRVIGQGLMTLYVVGRKTGKQYTVPMAYLRHEDALLLGSGFPWGKNLRTGKSLEVRFKGKLRLADVRVLTDEAEVVQYYDIIARRNSGFARINKIRLGNGGNPDTDDLHAAWATGARVFLLHLR